MTSVFSSVLKTEKVVRKNSNSTSHALINIIENIRKALDDGNISCGVFVD